MGRTGRKEDQLNQAIIEIVKVWQSEGGKHGSVIYQRDIEAILNRTNAESGGRSYRQLHDALINRRVLTSDLLDKIELIRPHLHQNLGNRLARLNRLGFLSRLSRPKGTLGRVRWTLGPKEYHPEPVEERVRREAIVRIKKTQAEDMSVAPSGVVVSFFDVPDEIRRQKWLKPWFMEMEEEIWQMPLTDYEIHYCQSFLSKLLKLDEKIQAQLVKAHVSKVPLEETEFLCAGYLDGFKDLEERRATRGRMKVHVPRGWFGGDGQDELCLYSYILQQCRALPPTTKRNVQLREEALHFIKYPEFTLNLGKMARTEILYLPRTEQTPEHLSSYAIRNMLTK